ncbi:histone H2A-Bbd type 1-like [Dipodomys merriami]|uniref:histone H2A-Bbd type 1-like n=1 Tax=Dipodomys merriami TaxID=94247 RepID=UPI003855921E
MARTKRSENTPKSRRNPVTRSARAELQFPVSRVDRFLREGNYAQRLSSSTPVFLSGVLEYLVSNILDLAGNEARRNGRTRITPDHVKMVIENQKQFHYNIRTLGGEKNKPKE